MKKLILLIITIFTLSGCTQIVTAPVSLAGKAVSTTVDVAGSVGGAIVNTVSGGSKD